MLARYEETVQSSDEALVARCCAGDLDAFGQLYARYERQVFRYAYHLLGNRDDADDIKQETFLKAYHAMPRFRYECSLLTWLLKIGGNLCRDRLKSRARRSEVSLDLPETERRLQDDSLSLDPVAVVERKQTAEIVFRALQGMPEAQRDIILLHEIEGMSYQEMAEVMDCSIASIKIKLFRARRRFKERVGALLEAR